MEPFTKPALPTTVTSQDLHDSEPLPTNVETWLLSPYPAPDFSLPNSAGQTKSLSDFQGKPVLLYLWSSEGSGLDDSKTLFEPKRKNGSDLRLLAVQVAGDPLRVNDQFSLPDVALRGSEDFAAIYNILYRQLFDRHRDLTLPTSFLIDAAGNIVKLYQGPIDPADLDHDLQRMPQSDSERLARALPFASTRTLNLGRNYLSYGALFFQRGYLDPAENAFQQALRDDPSSAEALYGIGSVYLNQNKNAAARDIFERAVKLQANYPDTLPDSWNNLGVIATRENRIEDAIQNFKLALQVNPRHLLSLDNLGNAYRMQKRYDDARAVLDRALEVSPEDAEANYSLGMVYAQTDDTAKAYDHLQRALKARPVYPEALNNLGILYLVTERRDDAVATFEQCIRVAPAFDQAYLNLAKVYALEGVREKARRVLQDLLQQHPDHPQAKQMLEQLQK
jgi:tetratricopeptide (TPR) repeat protein